LKESRRNIGGAKIRGGWKKERDEFMTTKGIESHMFTLGEEEEAGSYKKIERTNREKKRYDKGERNQDITNDIDG
jgi:hypothetical protein